MPRRFTAHRPKPARFAQAVPTRPRVSARAEEQPARGKANDRPRETGGPSGPEPTRYGDWERKGICVDF